MPATSPPSITSLPAAPDPNDRATFNTRAYPWAAAQGVLASEVSAVSTNVYNNALAAEAAVVEAEDAATAAAAAANFKGAWSSLSGALAIPASVSHGGAVYILTSNVANVALETPGVSSAWLLLSPVKRQSILSASSASLTPVSGLELIENSNPSGVDSGGGIVFGSFCGLFISDRVTSGSVVYSSPDGETWTARNMPSSGVWKVGVGTTNFVATKIGSTETAISTDGVTWSAGAALPGISGTNAIPVFFSASSSWQIQGGASTTRFISNTPSTAWSSSSLSVGVHATARLMQIDYKGFYFSGGNTYYLQDGTNSYAAKTLPFTPTSNFYATVDFDGAILACDNVAGAHIYRTADGITWTDTGKIYGEMSCNINGIPVALGSTLGSAMSWHGGIGMIRRTYASFPAPDLSKRIAKNTAGTVFLVPSTLTGCVTRIAPGEASAKKASFS